MKWQFPRRVADKTRELFGKARKQASRYTFDKEGAKRLGSDVEQGLNVLGDRLDTAIEPNDPIYHEPVHKKPPTEDTERILTRGPVDYYFLFIVVALCLFGAVMAFSASSVYAAQYHDEPTYYVKRHLIYLVLAAAVTVPFVWKARPWFWRFFGVASYAISVVLLLLVLIIGSSYGSGIYFGKARRKQAERGIFRHLLF